MVVVVVVVGVTVVVNYGNYWKETTIHSSRPETELGLVKSSLS